MNTLVLVANAGEGTVSSLRLSGDNLENLTESVVGAGISAFVVDRSRDLIHAATADAVVTLRLDRSTGALTELAMVSDAGPMVSLALAHDGTVLLGASYHAGHVATWPLTDGIPGPRVGAAEYANAHCVLVNGDLAYVASLGEDLIAQFQVGTDATLTPLTPATVACPAGSGPRHLALAGDNAYLVTEFSTEAIRFDVAADGALSAKEAARFDDPSQDLAHSRFGAEPLNEHLRWGADVHLAGGWLLASERTGSTIASIQLDEAGKLGDVAAVTPVPTQPRGFGVSDDGTRVLAVGERSHDAVLFQIEESGHLTELSRATVGTKARWVEFV